MIPSSLKANVMLRGGTKARWEFMNPVLGMREPGLELDTHRFKVGNGRTAWLDLPYWDNQDSTEISDAVAAYFLVNPVKDGEDGEDATIEQVADAVASYLQTNPPEPGEKGDPGTTTWAGITDKPSTFAPAPHNHPASDITGLVIQWADVQGKPVSFLPSPHGHSISDVSGLQTALDARLQSVSWAQVTGKPTTFTPSSHTHVIADITGLQPALDARGNTPIGTATVTETALIALTAGVRKVNVPIAGVVPNANYALFPTGQTPAGYAIADVVCVNAGMLQVSVTAPLLALGATYSIPVRVVRINT